MIRLRDPRLRPAALVLAGLLALPACGHLHWPHMSGQGKATKEEKPAPIDLNHAPLSKIEALPGITPTMAKQIVDGRPYDDPIDLVRRGILTRHEFRRIDDLVTVERPAS
jgi:DNA uptake protein ComE-like DNA-binding protein